MEQTDDVTTLSERLLESFTNMFSFEKFLSFHRYTKWSPILIYCYLHRPSLLTTINTFIFILVSKLLLSKLLQCLTFIIYQSKLLVVRYEGKKYFLNPAILRSTAQNKWELSGSIGEEIQAKYIDIHIMKPYCIEEKCFSLCQRFAGTECNERENK